MDKVQFLAALRARVARWREVPLHLSPDEARASHEPPVVAQLSLLGGLR